jgi:dTDP-glucose pyrophosphorylase
VSAWKSTAVSPDTSLADVIRRMDEAGLPISLVVGDDQRLLGTITDGDVRRAILKALDLSTSCAQVMNPKPHTVSPDTTPDQMAQIMRNLGVRYLPVVNSYGGILGLVGWDEVLTPQAPVDCWVVLMAGGLGTRLRPLTETTPKPMLPIGGKPILETIIEGFVTQGFRRFFISVNYRAETVKDHFQDGSRWGVDIHYLEEREQRGTGGALTLLPELPIGPLIIMNGDVLTKVNYRSLLDFHAEHKAVATMCVREYQFQVPFGVVTLENHRIAAIDEKPMHRFLVNAGIYVLDPQAMAHIPASGHYDMPTLFEALLSENLPTAAFPIREYWLDVGRHGDLEKANWDYESIFT